MQNHPPTPTQYLAILVLVLCLGSCSAPGGDTTDSNEPVNHASAEDRVISELLSDLSVVEEKLLALGDAFTEEQYDWRPADGVRSAAEVFMHVAAFNFAFPLLAGHKAPASTGLTMDNLPTAAPAYENSLKSKDRIRPELRASFENLRTAIESTSASDLERQVKVFDDTITLRALWIGQVSHLHEHLGQLIAYSRMNGVVPPWSQ